MTDQQTERTTQESTTVKIMAFLGTKFMILALILALLGVDWYSVGAMVIGGALIAGGIGLDNLNKRRETA